MHKKEDSAPQSDQPVSNSHNWIKKLTLILTSVLLLTIVGLGGYWLGARQQQSSPTNLITTPKPRLVASVTPVQQLSAAPTIVPSQADPTDNWKIYRNTKDGFEMKYPPTYGEGYISNTSNVPPAGFSGGTRDVDGTEDNTTILFDEPSTSESNGRRILLDILPYSEYLDDLVKDS